MYVGGAVEMVMFIVWFLFHRRLSVAGDGVPMSVGLLEFGHASGGSLRH